MADYGDEKTLLIPDHKKTIDNSRLKIIGKEKRKLKIFSEALDKLYAEEKHRLLQGGLMPRLSRISRNPMTSRHPYMVNIELKPYDTNFNSYILPSKCYEIDPYHNYQDKKLVRDPNTGKTWWINTFRPLLVTDILRELQEL